MDLGELLVTLVAAFVTLICKPLMLFRPGFAEDHLSCRRTILISVHYNLRFLTSFVTSRMLAAEKRIEELNLKVVQVMLHLVIWYFIYLLVS